MFNGPGKLLNDVFNDLWLGLFQIFDRSDFSDVPLSGANLILCGMKDIQIIMKAKEIAK